MVFELILKKLSNDGFMFESLLSDVLATILTMIITAYGVIPFVSNQRKIRHYAKRIGGPACHWLYGNMHKISYDYVGYNNLIALTDKFPKYAIRWHSNFFYNIAAYHPDIVRPVLTGKHHKGPLVKKVMDSLVPGGLISADDEAANFHRRILSPFFHFDIIKSHVELFNECCEDMLQWCGKLAETGESGDIVEPIQQLTYQASMKAVFSLDMREDSNGQEFVEAIQTTASTATQRLNSVIYLASDFVWLKISPAGRKIQSISRTISKRANEFIDARKKLLKETDGEPEVFVKGKGSDPNQSFKLTGDRNYVDFLDILVQAKDIDGKPLPDTDIQKEICTFFAAGQETVATGLIWLLHALACNLPEQEKCRQELFEKIGDKDFITSDEETRLTYMTLVIKEAQRLYPIIPSVGRQLVHDVTLPDGVVLPKGTNVNITFYVLHRNPQIWKNPLKFDPERFTPERSEGRSPFAFLPFAAGPRNCIGQTFAMHQTRVVLYHILKNYEVYYDTIPDVEKDMILGITLQPGKGIHLKFRKVKI